MADFVFSTGLDSSGVEEGLGNVGDTAEESFGETEQAAKGAQEAIDQVSDAQKRWIAQTVGAEAAEKKRAEALGLTVRQLRAMDAALADVEEAADGAAKKVEDLSDDAKKAAANVEDVADVGGEGERVMRGLADAMDLAGNEAGGDFARGMADAGGALEGLLLGGKNLLPLLGKLAPALSVGALGVSALGVAYSFAANEASIASEESDQINASLTEQERLLALARTEALQYTDAWKSFTGQAQAIQDQIDLINGKINEQEFASKKAEAQLRAAAEPAIQANRALLAVTDANIDAQKRFIETLEAGSEPRKQEERQLERLRDKRREVADELEEQEATLETAILQADALATHTDHLATSKEREAAARRANAAAMREENAEKRQKKEQVAREAAQDKERQEAQDQQVFDELAFQLQLLNNRRRAEEQEATATQAARDAELSAAEAHALAMLDVSTRLGQALANSNASFAEVSLQFVRDFAAKELAILAGVYAKKAAAAALAGEPLKAAGAAAAAASLGGAGVVAGAGGIGAIREQRNSHRRRNS